MVASRQGLQERRGKNNIHFYPCICKPVVSALLSGYKPFPFELDHASGDRLYDPSGQSWYDYYGGHCVASTGHCHPQVVTAIEQQARRLLFYSTAGEISIRHRAADALAAFADGTGCSRVFFINSGAEANENALKMAFKMRPGRTHVAAIEHSFHGRTAAAAAATWGAPPSTTTREGR